MLPCMGMFNKISLIEVCECFLEVGFVFNNIASVEETFEDVLILESTWLRLEDKGLWLVISSSKPLDKASLKNAARGVCDLSENFRCSTKSWGFDVLIK